MERGVGGGVVAVVRRFLVASSPTYVFVAPSATAFFMSVSEPLEASGSHRLTARSAAGMGWVHWCGEDEGVAGSGLGAAWARPSRRAPPLGPLDAPPQQDPPRRVPSAGGLAARRAGGVVQCSLYGRGFGMRANRRQPSSHRQRQGLGPPRAANPRPRPVVLHCRAPILTPSKVYSLPPPHPAPMPSLLARRRDGWPLAAPGRGCWALGLAQCLALVCPHRVPHWVPVGRTDREWLTFHGPANLLGQTHSDVCVQQGLTYIRPIKEGVSAM